MLLKSLHLKNFRNYSDVKHEFSPSTTLLVGANAKGKTNLIEALHIICTGKGLREEKQEEFIKLGSAVTDMRAVFDDMEFRIHLKKEEKLVKTYFVDKAKKTLYTYNKSTPPAVVFTPEMISIIDGSPSKRRRFIDSILSKLDIEYRKRLNNYENGLRRRNKVFEKERNEDQLKEVLVFWNDYLIQQADYLVEKRRWLVDEFNKEQKLDSHEFRLIYQENQMSEERFEEYFKKEYYQMRTLIGPQRDDFGIETVYKAEQIDVQRYGSRGEQRLALFWLILRNVEMYKEHLGQKPLLLLDDIFSELDEHNKEIVFDMIDKHQTVITTIQERVVGKVKKGAKVIHL